MTSIDLFLPIVTLKVKVYGIPGNHINMHPKNGIPEIFFQFLPLCDLQCKPRSFEVNILYFMLLKDFIMKCLLSYKYLMKILHI